MFCVCVSITLTSVRGFRKFPGASGLGMGNLAQTLLWGPPLVSPHDSTLALRNAPPFSAGGKPSLPSSFQALSALALRRLLGPGATSTDAAASTARAEVLRTCSGVHLVRALRQATDRAWVAVAVVLAGKALWKRFEATGERGLDGEFDQPLRALVNSVPIAPLREAEVEILQAWWSLQEALHRGTLTAGRLEIGDVLASGAEAGSDDAEWADVERLAGTFADAGHPEFRPLFHLRYGREGPLLVLLVAALFRHAVEADPDLFDDLPPLLAKSEPGAVPDELRPLAAVLDRHRGRLDALLAQCRPVELLRTVRQSQVTESAVPLEEAQDVPSPLAASKEVGPARKRTAVPTSVCTSPRCREISGEEAEVAPPPRAEANTASGPVEHPPVSAAPPKQRASPPQAARADAPAPAPATQRPETPIPPTKPSVPQQPVAVPQPQKPRSAPKIATPQVAPTAPVAPPTPVKERAPEVEKQPASAPSIKEGAPTPSAPISPPAPRQRGRRRLWAIHSFVQSLVLVLVLLGCGYVGFYFGWAWLAFWLLGHG